MAVTDPLADMLTRIRNASLVRFSRVDVPASKIKISVARILKSEGYIKNYKLIKNAKQQVIRIYLKYTHANQSAIAGIRRQSKLSRRVYVKKNEIPMILSGMGIAILSTSIGVLTGREAKQKNVGGEFLCSVW
ncbi:MAG: 30S ribosomal protein S8 [Desulfobacterales bacterium]|nr:30S ribosomal protein S8 [Desulfobacterales bacterium]